MRVWKYKGLFQSTALASLAASLGTTGFAQQLATVDPAVDIREYYGDDDPADDAFSTDLTDRALIGGITADGSAFVGSVFRSYAQSIYNGYVWTATHGIRPVGDRNADAPLAGREYYTATGVSADGSVVVGTGGAGVIGGEDFTVLAYRWTDDGGFVSLGSLDGSPLSEATAVSGDGMVVAGNSHFGTGSAAGVQAVRWTEDGQIHGLGWLPGRDSAESNDTATALSFDGSVIVGSALSSTNVFQAFRWTEATGMQALPTLAAFSPSRNTATATGISWDGTVIAGHSHLGFANQAVRWVDGEISSLGGLDGSDSIQSLAYAISGNGAVIVGETQRTGSEHAFRWTESDGMITVEEWLRDSGATIAANITDTAEATNEDGSVIVGLTRDNEVYIARGTGTGPTGGFDPDPVDPDPVDPDPVDPDPVDPDPVDPDPGTGLITLGSLSSSLTGAAWANSALTQSLGLVVNGAGSRPLDRRVAVGDTLVWASGDWGRDDHEGRDGSLGLGEVGFGYNLGEVQVNGVFGATGFDQDTLLGGTTEVRARYIKLEAMTQLSGTEDSGLWAVVTGTGLWGTADITRNYAVNGGLIDSSNGEAHVEGFGLRGRLAWENAMPHVSPYGELSFARTCLDGYTETGGAFPASFDALCEESTEFRYGFDAQVPVTDQLRLIGTLEGVHRMDDGRSPLTGQVAELGAFDLGRAEIGQDWLRAGAGFEFDVAGSTLSVIGNTTTEGASSSAWIAASWRMTF